MLGLFEAAQVYEGRDASKLPLAVSRVCGPRSRKRVCYGLSRLRTGEAAEAPHRSVRVVTIVGCGRRNA